MWLPWGLVSYLYSATEGCDKLGQFATFLVQGNTALPGICEHLVGVPGDYHGLMVGVHKVVGVPERGIVQILQYPSGGAILLPVDHHAVLSDSVLVRWHLLQYTQMSLATGQGHGVGNIGQWPAASSLHLAVDFHHCRGVDTMWDSIRLD